MYVFVFINFKKYSKYLATSLILLAICLALFDRDFNDYSNFVAVFSETESAEIELIIDAGHGGEDGGAVSANGDIESEINLSVALKLEAIAGLFGVSTVMTRETEDIYYPDTAETVSARKAYDQNTRISLINEYPEAVLISIHQNFYPDSAPRGSQVLYGAQEGSQKLGELCNELLRVALYPENRRVAMPVSEDIYLMKSVTCTSILVECGYLSNETELELLLDDDYQTKISATILAAYLQYIT